MQIVIDIPEELYNYIMTEGYDEHLDRRFDYQIRFAVKDGIPLPKGHGRLKDADKIEALLDLDKAENVFDKAFVNIIESVPTIIEADAESEDEE